VRRIILLVCVAVLGAGCSDSTAAWQKAIRGCKVREVEILHSGVIYVRPKTGPQIELHGVNEQKVLRELNRAERRCGGVRLLME
jgi:hypothetical protein